MGDDEWKHRLGGAVRACYEGRLTQTDVGRTIGVDQGTVSNWSRGVNQPGLDDIARVERACHRPKGWILTHGGFVDETISVLAAIEMDPHLNDAARAALRGAYQGIVAEQAGTPVSGNGTNLGRTPAT